MGRPIFQLWKFLLWNNAVCSLTIIHVTAEVKSHIGNNNDEPILRELLLPQSVELEANPELPGTASIDQNQALKPEDPIRKSRSSMFSLSPGSQPNPTVQGQPSPNTFLKSIEPRDDRGYSRSSTATQLWDRMRQECGHACPTLHDNINALQSSYYREFQNLYDLSLKKHGAMKELQQDVTLLKNQIFQTEETGMQFKVQMENEIKTIAQNVENQEKHLHSMFDTLTYHAESIQRMTQAAQQGTESVASVSKDVFSLVGRVSESNQRVQQLHDQLEEQKREHISLKEDVSYKMNQLTGMNKITNEQIGQLQSGLQECYTEIGSIKHGTPAIEKRIEEVSQASEKASRTAETSLQRVKDVELFFLHSPLKTEQEALKEQIQHNARMISIVQDDLKGSRATISSQNNMVSDLKNAMVRRMDEFKNATTNLQHDFSRLSIQNHHALNEVMTLKDTIQKELVRISTGQRGPVFRKDVATKLEHTVTDISQKQDANALRLEGLKREMGQVKKDVFVLSTEVRKNRLTLNELMTSTASEKDESERVPEQPLESTNIDDLESEVEGLKKTMEGIKTSLKHNQEAIKKVFQMIGKIQYDISGLKVYAKEKPDFREDSDLV